MTNEITGGLILMAGTGAILIGMFKGRMGNILEAITEHGYALSYATMRAVREFREARRVALEDVRGKR